MFASNRASAEDPAGSGAQVERRHADRIAGGCPAWIGERAGTPEEVAQLKEFLAFNARQMAELRKRNEQLMAITSDLRCKLGEMTLRWVDSCERNGR
jgi:hypothetical protein